MLAAIVSTAAATNAVDQERLRLKSMVSEFVLEPTTQPWGTRSMLFRDPDGNLINFFTRLDRQDLT